MSAALGAKVPTPLAHPGSDVLLCTYNNATSGVNVVLEFQTSAATTAANLEQVTQSEAQAQNVSAAVVPGLGDLAYGFTLTDASTNANGIATSTVVAVKGGQLISVTADAKLTHVEAVVRLALSH